MHLYISIVSHLHHSIIINLGTIKTLASHPDITVVCRDNIQTKPLTVACKKYHVHYIANKQKAGFAANNNANFLYCKDTLGMKDDDYFVILNPDIFMTNQAITTLVSSLKALKHDFYAPNLLLDNEQLMLDDNIRVYPKFINFLETYLLNKRATMVNRKAGLLSTHSYWASGAFLIIKAKLYQSAKGLDERYYLYCEDIDFCERLKIRGIHFHYLEHVKPIHYRRRDSKRFMTRYFWWHVFSVFRYSFSKKKFEARKSKIQ
ncbi:glycosyltransferase [Photobacterium leiognathi]|uniref:glycosyltransferase n=1 Tax=Photobacterium leiognathi TaxID=553611 RepID=UPI002980E82E|nr:glycosyltransferase [Photobacterium leiognathi]